MDELIEWLEAQGAAPDPERILFELCRSLYAGDISSEKDLQDAAEYILEFWQDQTPGELGWNGTP